MVFFHPSFFHPPCCSQLVAFKLCRLWECCTVPAVASRVLCVRSGPVRLRSTAMPAWDLLARAAALVRSTVEPCRGQGGSSMKQPALT